MAQGKKHEPTEETRKKVQLLSGMGIPQEQIAKLLEISVPTLLKHYRDDIDLGVLDANTKVAQSLFRMATGKKPVPAAAIFWAKTRMKWRETEEAKEDKEISVTIKDATPDRAVTLGKGTTKRSRK